MNRRSLLSILFGQPLMSLTVNAASAPQKVLVAYYCRVSEMPAGADAVTHATPSVGNVREAAEAIAKATDGTLYEIRTSQKYPLLHTQNSKQAKAELDSDFLPEITGSRISLKDYDLIFIGFPIWWYREPMVIRSFLRQYDWAGKKIVPFCVSMAVDIQQSELDIKKLCPGAQVLSGQRFPTEDSNIRGLVRRWLNTSEFK